MAQMTEEFFKAEQELICSHAVKSKTCPMDKILTLATVKKRHFKNHSVVYSFTGGSE